MLLLTVSEVTIGAVGQLIMQLGAPLAFCILLAWYVKYKDDKNREDMKEIMNAHKIESEKFADALNKNTIVLERLSTMIDLTVPKTENKKDE